MLLFPAGAAPCQGTLATPSCSEGADCCPLSSTCSKGDREDPSVLWEKGDPVTDRCQLPQAPSWGGKDPWKQQGNGGRDLNPEGNFLEWLPWLGDQSVAREAAGWHWGPRTGHSPRDWAEARGAPGLPAGGVGPQHGYTAPCDVPPQQGWTLQPQPGRAPGPGDQGSAHPCPAAGLWSCLSQPVTQPGCLTVIPPCLAPCRSAGCCFLQEKEMERCSGCRESS